jgi:hypothetical protein
MYIICENSWPLKFLSPCDVIIINDILINQSTIDIETGVAACGFALIRDKPHGVQERVLAINTNFRSHLSAHCIVVLTTHRIVLLSNAGLKETTFANLSELSTTSFCKCEIALHYIGPKSPVIKLDPTEILPKEPIKRTSRPLRKVDPYIGFPDSIIRDLWYRMFKEVVFGWHMVFSELIPPFIMLIGGCFSS